MRQLALVLILTVSLLFSYYSDPPFSLVKLHNNDRKASIQSTYLYANKEYWVPPSFEDPVEFAGATILLMFPSVDERISADNATHVMWVWAERHSQREERNDGSCIDVIEFSDFEISGNMFFSFRNITKSLPLNTSTDFELSLPFSQQELNQTNGTDQLVVEINARAIFTYYLYDYELHCTIFGCSCVLSKKEKIKFIKPLHDRRNYTVEGGSVIFFLADPVLREQWYKNNKFNNILLSKRLFYKGSIFLNEEKLAFFNLYSFNITEDKYGLWHIVSYENVSANNMVAIDYDIALLPIPLEKQNESFSVLTVLNSSYKEVIGLNNLSVSVFDHFVNAFKSERTIASRVLSYGNITEDKAQHNDQEKRKGATPFSYFAYVEEHSFGLVGILLVALLAFSKIIRK